MEKLEHRPQIRFGLSRIRHSSKYKFNDPITFKIIRIHAEKDI